MCGHRSRYRYVSADRSERILTRDPEIRASQAERERVIELLRTHAGEGRLELDELEQRVEAGLAARTRGELEALLADLPGGLPARRRRRPTGLVAIASLAIALLPLWGGIAILALAPPALAWIGWVAIGCWFFGGMPSRRRARRTVVV